MRIKLLIIINFLLFLSIQVLAYSYERVDSTVTAEYKVIHFQENSVPWDIYVLELDLTTEGIRLKTGLANNKVAYMDGAGTNFTQKETLSSMIQRRNAMGEYIVGGINADFFDMSQGRQFNVTATGGRIASTGITNMPHAALYTDESGVPYIHLIDMEQTMTINGTDERSVNSVNNVRRADHLVIYNGFTGISTSFANQWGIELLLEPMEDVYLNGRHKYRVVSKATNVSMASNGQIIASGHGAAHVFLNKAVSGDTVEISTSFAGIGDEKIYEMIGGWGHIVKKGANMALSSIEEEGTMMHENDRHPRSAVCYNRDKTKLYLVAIDGRSDVSKGMNLSELADFMTDELSAWDGLNFDGGGSTTLMAGSQTINNVSGNVQRAIANALLISGKKPVGAERLQNKRGISLFPNPAKKFITIELEDAYSGNLFFEVYHPDGRMVSKKPLQGTQQNNNQFQINVAQLKPGTYLYSVATGTHRMSSGKLVIQ